MLWYTLFVLASASHHGLAFSISDIVSNYAKVSVNNGSQHENITTSSSTTTTTPETNTTAEDDESVEYDDFDDTTEPAQRSSSFDNDNVMKYFNGFVNLLALMYKFSGNGAPVRKEQLHFGNSAPPDVDSRPRNAPDPLIENINQLAEERFNPNTATKKFKLQQGAYTSKDYPSYNPSADSYSNSGKTSYDSDSSQYMVKNPEDSSDVADAGMPEKANVNMDDYMSQNNPVEIHQSYSYELPQDTMTKKEKPIPDSQGWNPQPTKPDLYYPWLMGSRNKKPALEEQPWMKPEKKPTPVYYPWKSKPMETRPQIEEDMPPVPWNTKPKNQWMDHKQPVDEEPLANDEDLPTLPWNKKPIKKPWMNRKPPIEEEEEVPIGEEEGVPPSWDGDTKPKTSKSKSPPLDDEVYYPWPNQGPPKKMKGPPPPPLEDDHHSPEDHPYLYYPPDDHHGLIPEHHDEDDHDMKDEDRESKRPYTYYHLGRKLWYVPLLFSLYFIVYIGALILKSIARHKVEFPQKLWELGDHHHHDHDHGRMNRRVNEVSQRVYNSIEKAKNKYM